VFLTCLTLAELLTAPAAAGRERYQTMLAERRQRLATWTGECAVNFLHKKLLVDAEAARLGGDAAAAIDAYERAIEAARENNFPHHEAIASELCGRFHLGRGRKKIARFYMTEALLGYERWGVTVKVQRLRKLYPELLPQSGFAADESISRHTTSSLTTFITTEGTGGLDLSSFMKASGAITSEIVMDRLLGRLIEIMVENAGAEQGSLLLLRGDELFVEAQMRPDTGFQEVGLSVPLSAAEHLCEAVVRYVWRTQENVVLGDAQTSGHFQKNRTIQERHVRSVLCAPIKHHGKLTGILYLENNLMPGAFTQDRLRVLDLLSAQAATSLENARLYETLDQRVKERTEELRRSNEDLSQTLERLQITQKQLVMQEKLASLGALTSGIAHEIKNPLNFVNNFAESSVEISSELLSAVKLHREQPDTETLDSIEELVSDLKENASRINEHGQRADRIVKAMLEHSRGSTGEKCEVDLNALIAQYLTLAVGGVLSRNETFEVQIETHYDPNLAPILNTPQDLGRVILNLVNNACYAVRAKKEQNGEGYAPTIWVSTKSLGDEVEFRVRDNGTGIPESLRERIFVPFFTTKPTGEGTGLGLSISYDIVVHANGGELRCESEEGQFTEFIVRLRPQGTSPAARREGPPSEHPVRMGYRFPSQPPRSGSG
jgi:signal transduction histidine kinase